MFEVITSVVAVPVILLTEDQWMLLFPCSLSILPHHDQVANPIPITQEPLCCRQSKSVGSRVVFWAQFLELRVFSRLNIDGLSCMWFFNAILYEFLGREVL